MIAISYNLKRNVTIRNRETSTRYVSACLSWPTAATAQASESVSHIPQSKLSRMQQTHIMGRTHIRWMSVTQAALLRQLSSSPRQEDHGAHDGILYHSRPLTQLQTKTSPRRPRAHDGTHYRSRPLTQQYFKSCSHKLAKTGTDLSRGSKSEVNLPA